MIPLWGPCIRRIEPADAAASKTLYLTFDDGPDTAGTPATLAVLDQFGVKATFFVIAEAARKNPQLVRHLAASGHGIGNHSLDHTWRPFFGTRRGILAWISRAEEILRDVVGQPSIGFRSPAGVQTPPLHWALRQLRMPLIHWNIRFFDAVRPWSERAALAALQSPAPGSIILLHDRQRAEHRQLFLATLTAFLQEGQRRGYVFSTLPPQSR